MVEEEHWTTVVEGGGEAVAGDGRLKDDQQLVPRLGEAVFVGRLLSTTGSGRLRNVKVIGEW